MRRRHQRVGNVGIAYVDHDGHRTPTLARDRDLRVAGAIRVDFGDHDRRAFAREPFGDSAADAAAPTRDDRDLAFEKLSHGRGR